MRIPLKLDKGSHEPVKVAQAKVLEHDIEAARKGDWTAKNNLVRVFTPLLASLARKRTAEVAEINALIDAGKEGLFKAAKKYKPSAGPDRFQLFALDYIETEMDSRKKGAGFFARLFGR